MSDVQACIRDVERTILIWRTGPMKGRVTAFEAWKALGNPAWAGVHWGDVCRCMIVLSRGGSTEPVIVYDG